MVGIAIYHSLAYVFIIAVLLQPSFRLAPAQTAGRKVQPEAWAAFSVRLAGPWLRAGAGVRHTRNALLAPSGAASGARRSDGKAGCRAAIAPLPAGSDALAGMGTGFYIGLSFGTGRCG